MKNDRIEISIKEYPANGKFDNWVRHLKKIGYNVFDRLDQIYKTQSPVWQEDVIVMDICHPLWDICKFNL